MVSFVLGKDKAEGLLASRILYCPSIWSKGSGVSMMREEVWAARERAEREYRRRGGDDAWDR